ncbi:cysteine desulfurase [Rhizomicrobium palustre]|uniref:Cysteine desulfurase n=1 Tax=Rhizomicrobium palustre TaxID=189966 RepID=A0A846N1S2_9PROT|nr:cysteine desulfurase family protein [Rhizomicrobium palustre]NIK89425.1 cysteine desulfurase [Rhizomicrobium palustre]
MAYLDYNATSPLRAEAKVAAERAFALGGNASSVHASGRAARALIEEARQNVAALGGARAEEVIFTSGATESNALALWGAVMGSLEARDAAKDATARITRLFVSAIEHPAVLENAKAVAERFAGLRLEFIPVRTNGVVDLDALKDLLREGKGRALVALMAANNETGVVQPVDEVLTLVRAEGALLLVDAVQAAGKIALPAADYLTLSAHKLGGLQGAGALIVRTGIPYAPLITGGGQERGARAGTENLAGIAAFGAAATAAAQENVTPVLRDRFEAGLRKIAQEVTIFGVESLRLPNTSNFSLAPIPAETALMALDLDGVMLSSGAACSSGKVKRSHVLAAMGISEDVGACALRASFGWNSTEADVDAALSSISKLVARRRAAA